MQGLKLHDFGRFVFDIEYGSKKYEFDIEGAEITDMDHLWIWLSCQDGDCYNVKKANVKLFEPMEK